MCKYNQPKQNYARRVSFKMKNSSKKIIRSALSLALIIVLFILVSVFVKKNIGFLETYVDSVGFFSMAVYIFLLALSIVFVPFSAIPLMPIAAELWGVPTAAMLVVFGWTIGSVIAFWLARRYGRYFVEKIISLKTIERAERLIPEEHIFLTIVFLTMVMPYDGLAYVLGLFTKIKMRTFFLATFAGLIPSAFVFSYLGTLPVIYQITGFLLAILILLFSILRAEKKYKRLHGQ